MKSRSKAFLDRRANPSLREFEKLNLICPQKKSESRYKNLSLSPVGADASVHVWFLAQMQYSIRAQKQDIYNTYCIYHDRLGFCAEIQIIFGPV